MSNIPRLLDLLMDQKSDPSLLQPCQCRRDGQYRDTRCKDCLFSHTTCAQCFIERHKAEPTHWAEVWDERGYFIKKDISELGQSIHLGHDGLDCPNPTNNDIAFIVVDTNGIHRTKVRFCSCSGHASDRVHQLMRSSLFPSTTTQPTMAFTFNVLKSFHMHHLQSKQAAGDFVESLRRLTDNVFTTTVPVS